MVVAVGVCITEAPIRGLSILRDPSVYISIQWNCVGSAIVLVVVGSGLGRRCVFVLDGVCGGLSQ